MNLLKQQSKSARSINFLKILTYISNNDYISILDTEEY